MTKKKKKKPAEILIHMTRSGPGNDEDLLILGEDTNRIERLQAIGFVVASSYRLVRTAVGQVAITLPSTGVFADACSALAQSPHTGEKHE